MINAIYRYVKPRFGRLTESELEMLGHGMQPCAFFSIGPLIVLIDLPERFQRHDPVISLAELNASARRIAEEFFGIP